MDSFGAPSARGLEECLDWVVHQAECMIAVQLNVPVREATSRLDAYCRAQHETKHDVAVQIVERHLRLEP